MDHQIIQLIEEKIQSHPDYQKWQKKEKSFFNGFNFLKKQDLIDKQMSQLTHVGINSLSSSSQIVHDMTAQNIDMIENTLNKITSEMSGAITLLEDAEKCLKKKATFFNKKSTSDYFIEFFNEQYPNLKVYVNNLLIKQREIEEQKEKVNKNSDLLIEQLSLLKKDEKLLSKAKDEFKNHLDDMISSSYESISFDVNQNHIDLITQQTIMYQKYMAMQILKNNLQNCHRNIQYLSRTSSSAVLNIAETHQIIKLTSEDDMVNSLDLIKNTFNELNDSFKKFIKNPFSNITPDSNRLRQTM